MTEEVSVFSGLIYFITKIANTFCFSAKIVAHANDQLPFDSLTFTMELLQNKLITVTPDTKVLKAMELMTGTLFQNEIKSFIDPTDYLVKGLV